MRLNGDGAGKATATATFIQSYPDCAFCGATRKAVTREHMPPKALFDRSHRPDRLVMPSCQECNSETSTADLVVSVLARWRFGPGTAEEQEDQDRLIHRLHKQAPQIIQEWLRASADQGRARKHLDEFINLPAASAVASIGPQTIRQLNLFAHKLTLGLFFHEHRRPLEKEGCLWAFWKTKEDVIYGGLPEEVLNLLPGARRSHSGPMEHSRDIRISARPGC